MEKAWFHRELERVTREKWTVRVGLTDTFVGCKHGMKIWVPFPPGADESFLNNAAERAFLRRVLPVHQAEYIDRVATWIPNPV